MNISGVNFTGGFIVSPAVDNQFNYVTALLHGDGASAGTNNTFLDSSTNNFSITRTGNVTQGSVSPYSTLWSNYFNGSSYLTAGTTASNFLCTGSATGITATLEAWVYPTAYSTGGFVYNFSSVHSKGATYFNFGVRNGAVRFYWYDGATQKYVDSASTSDVPLNTWTYIVVTISGTTIKIYINGTLNTTSATYTGVATAGLNQSENIGIEGTTTYFSGYISNYRLTSTVVYSTSFTPPTAPLTAITGTALLICQSNRFKDNSTNNFAITVNGTPSVQPSFSPFGATIQYNPAVNGGSAYFGTTTDYLTVPSSSNFAFGTGDFTVEAWLYPVTAPNAGGTFFIVGSTTNGFIFGYQNATSWGAASNGGSWFITSTTLPTLNAWNYISITRSSGTAYLFLNGTLLTSAASAQNFPAMSTYIGHPSTNQSVNGYLSNLRALQGTALYTTSNTPPTTPLTAIANTSLLLNFTNAQIFGSAMTNNFITYGSAQVSTSIYKYGTGSMYFNGTTDYLVAPNSPNFNFGTGDFTIESWVYFNGSMSSAQFIATTNYNATTGAGGWAFTYRGDISSLELSVNSNVTYTKAWAPSVSIWYHVAVSRSGSNLRFFINGTQIGTTSTSSDNITGATTLVLGNNLGGAPNLYLNGYLDEFRMTYGYARYTSNFTAPTSQFPSTGPIPIYPSTVDTLVVAGGGTGGIVTINRGAGGGAGGLIYITSFPVTPGTAYTVTVGAGGASSSGTVAANGVNSSISGAGRTLTAIGGGSGGYNDNTNNGGIGGSGGGQWYPGPTGAASNQPVNTSDGISTYSTTGWGNKGGDSSSSQPYGSGGGGAGGAGGNWNGANGPVGGLGRSYDISGTSRTYAGGGSSAGYPPQGGTVVFDNTNYGGLGGGGTGYNNAYNTLANGAANTGGGGGSGGSGGSGVVILRFPNGYSPATSTTGSPTITVAGGYNIYTWTSSGSITF
jgi:hypothetical protein